MKRYLVAWATGTWMLLVSGDHALAGAKFPQGDARRSMGNLRPTNPNQNTQQPTVEGHGGAAGSRRENHWRYGANPGYYRPYHRGVYRYPQYPYEYEYGRYGYPYPYPYPPPWWNPYYVPPLYIPAEALYGPQAVKRFMGWEDGSRPQPNINIIVPQNNDGRPAGAAQQERPTLRGTNQKALALAWKFIGYGDAHFAGQKYSDACQRYRKAVRAAPQLAEGYFRQGYALAAMGRYDLAARALRRGLGLDPDWARSDFRNDELYGDNQLAKKAHLDAMAKAAEEKPQDADLLFLLGVYLHFDGQPDRAGAFLQRAGQIAGGDDSHLRGFLGQ